MTTDIYLLSNNICPECFDLRQSPVCSVRSIGIQYAPDSAMHFLPDDAIPGLYRGRLRPLRSTAATWGEGWGVDYRCVRVSNRLIRLKAG
jgi:hypothetical protein